MGEFMRDNYYRKDITSNSIPESDAIRRAAVIAFLLDVYDASTDKSYNVIGYSSCDVGFEAGTIVYSIIEEMLAKKEN